MGNMTKTQMLEALAELCYQEKFELYYGNQELSVEDYYKTFSTCDDLSTEIECIKPGTVNGIEIKIAYFTEYYSDNDEIELVFEFKKDNKSNYLKFTGRYSSWGSSAYYEVAEVFARTRTTVEYVSKTKLKD